jgi:penicillin V acylase-like amidase (Ntn superfamily)
MDIFACSAFMLKSKGECIVGFNENWISMPGIVMVNQRNLEKYGLSWAQLVSEQEQTNSGFSWKSQYGSVSFNLLGIDMPCYGVNEAGLFIVELFLPNTYSTPDDKKANLFWAQWIQYQLDNYATIEEVLAHLEEAPVIDWWPTFPGSHFFLADKNAKTAAIELIDGKFQVFYDKTMPVNVLCNTPYQKELQNLNKYEDFGGEKKMDMNSQNWGERFAKACYSIRHYDETKGSPVEYSWQLLDSLHAGQWQLVYDVKNGILQFRSDISLNIKTVRLSEMNFSSDSPPVYIDINTGLKGDVSGYFAPFNPKINQRYVKLGFPVGYENKNFYESESYLFLQRNINRYVEKVYYGIK